MNKIGDATHEVARAEYCNSIDRPTLTTVAEKYGVGVRTLRRWSALEKWGELRDQYWHELARQSASSERRRRQEGARAAADERERNRTIVEAIRDRLAAIIMLRREDLLNMWNAASDDKRIQLYPSYCKTLGELVKLSELLRGGATARIDLLSSPEWREFEEVLFEVLEDHPAARDALLEKLDRGTKRDQFTA